MPVFKTGAINHSANSPQRCCFQYYIISAAPSRRMRAGRVRLPPGPQISQGVLTQALSAICTSFRSPLAPSQFSTGCIISQGKGVTYSRAEIRVRSCDVFAVLPASSDCLRKQNHADTREAGVDVFEKSFATQATINNSSKKQCQQCHRQRNQVITRYSSRPQACD